MARTKLYRKIYKQYYGSVPKDSDGRFYEIHHIDGNRANNCIENLKAVTIQQHYDIHYKQSDWGACLAMAMRMKMSSEEISEINSKEQKRRIEAGTHNLLDEQWRKSYMSLEKRRQYQRKVRDEGRCHFSGGEFQRKLVNEGRHPLLGGNLHRRLYKEGRHPAQKIRQCSRCGYQGKGPNMFRYHFDKCKKNVID